MLTVETYWMMITTNQITHFCLEVNCSQVGVVGNLCGVQLDGGFEVVDRASKVLLLVGIVAVGLQLLSLILVSHLGRVLK